MRLMVDGAQAARVQRTAREILAEVARSWGFDEEDEALLAWGARLHEAGLAISHAQYHKHGAYLVRNADLLGFSTPEQLRLAVLVRSHRRKFPETAFGELPPTDAERMRRLALVLRLAVLLHRSRTPAGHPPLRVAAGAREIAVAFPPGWLAAHPLTAADLALEREYLARAGIILRAKTVRSEAPELKPRPTARRR
jgi:exopolyphosphatase/guanosine-5'-triphosphate,3'-diphosphate pyrophosphatase